MYRAMPPSTTSSQTRSAAFSPVCGRASTEFSIFTARAGRSTSPSFLLATPVSGHSTGGGGAGVAEELGALGALAAGAGRAPEPHAVDAVRVRPRSRAAPTRRRPTAGKCTFALLRGRLPRAEQHGQQGQQGQAAQ